MGLKSLLIIMAVVATIVAPTTAKLFLVGGPVGWSLGVDYQSWAAGKVFHVGDALVFRYTSQLHNVVRVNGTDFQACTAPLGAQPLTGGLNLIKLAAPGKKWYFCNVGAHCQLGMKLVIDVLPEESSEPSAAPAPSPAPAALPGPSGGTEGW